MLFLSALLHGASPESIPHLPGDRADRHSAPNGGFRLPPAAGSARGGGAGGGRGRSALARPSVVRRRRLSLLAGRLVRFIQG